MRGYSNGYPLETAPHAALRQTKVLLRSRPAADFRVPRTCTRRGACCACNALQLLALANKVFGHVCFNSKCLANAHLCVCTSAAALRIQPLSLLRSCIAWPRLGSLSYFYGVGLFQEQYCPILDPGRYYYITGKVFVEKSSGPPLVFWAEVCLGGTAPH